MRLTLKAVLELLHRQRPAVHDRFVVFFCLVFTVAHLAIASYFAGPRNRQAVVGNCRRGGSAAQPSARPWHGRFFRTVLTGCWAGLVAARPLPVGARGREAPGLPPAHHGCDVAGVAEGNPSIVLGSSIDCAVGLRVRLGAGLTPTAQHRPSRAHPVRRSASRSPGVGMFAGAMSGGNSCCSRLAATGAGGGVAGAPARPGRRDVRRPLVPGHLLRCRRRAASPRAVARAASQVSSRVSNSARRSCTATATGPGWSAPPSHGQRTGIEPSR